MLLIAYADPFLTSCPESPSKTAPNARHGEHDSQLSSLTPSQSASQIALVVTSDDSPARSSSVHQSHASPSSTLPRTSNIHTLSPLHTRPVVAADTQKEPDFKLDIGPAHSIDDHGQIHESIPSSHVMDSKKPEGDDSDGDQAPRTLEAHANHPFGRLTKPAEKSLPTTGPSKSESTRSTLRRPRPQRRDSKQETSKVGFPQMSSGSVKTKHTSDLGPRRAPTAPAAPLLSPAEEYNERLARKRSTSYSLLNGFTGLFKGKKRSASAERAYGVPLSTGGWHTRTDKNLSGIRGRERTGSSSEEELPSTLARKARHVDQDNESVDIPAGGEHKLSKRLSTSVARRGSKKRTPAETEGSKYIVVQRGERPPAGLVRTSSQSSKRSERVSSSETARETAANTAFNAGSSNQAKSSASRHTSLPPSDPVYNRLQGDVNARDFASPNTNPDNRLSTASEKRLSLTSSDARVTELGRISERLQRLEAADDVLRGGEPIPRLPSPKLELPRAPPSITQVPLLYHTTPSTSYGGERSAPARDSSFKKDGEGGFERGHRRANSLSGPSISAAINAGNGANLKARGSTSSRDIPLKSALKSPPRAGFSNLSPLSNVLATHDREVQQIHIPDLDKASAQELKKKGVSSASQEKGDSFSNGDSFSFPATGFGNGYRSPPTTSSSLVPSPRRLSEIPASNRTSLVSNPVGDSRRERKISTLSEGSVDDESVYETPVEDMSDDEAEDAVESGKTPIVSPVEVKAPVPVSLKQKGTAFPAMEIQATFLSTDVGSMTRRPEGERGTATPPTSIPSPTPPTEKHVPLNQSKPFSLTLARVDSPNGSRERATGRNDGPSSSTSTSSTVGAGSKDSGGHSKRKSVRMLIYPTVAVSPSEERWEESEAPETPREREEMFRGMGAFNGGSTFGGSRDKGNTSYNSGITSSSSRITEGGHGGARQEGAPSAWETRIDATRNAWQDSSDEDEEYRRARAALARAGKRE